MKPYPYVKFFLIAFKFYVEAAFTAAEIAETYNKSGFIGQYEL